MMHQTETINRESANGMIPEEEINFFVALTKLAEDSTNQVSISPTFYAQLLRK
jgi:hypothetical protein